MPRKYLAPKKNPYTIIFGLPIFNVVALADDFMRCNFSGSISSSSCAKVA